MRCACEFAVGLWQFRGRFLGFHLSEGFGVRRLRNERRTEEGKRTKGQEGRGKRAFILAGAYGPLVP